MKMKHLSCNAIARPVRWIIQIIIGKLWRHSFHSRVCSVKAVEVWSEKRVYVATTGKPSHTRDMFAQADVLLHYGRQTLVSFQCTAFQCTGYGAEWVWKAFIYPVLNYCLPSARSHWDLGGASEPSILTLCGDFCAIYWCELRNFQLSSAVWQQ